METWCDCLRLGCLTFDVELCDGIEILYTYRLCFEKCICIYNIYIYSVIYTAFCLYSVHSYVDLQRYIYTDKLSKHRIVETS